MSGTADTRAGLGQVGEELAASMLESSGYRVVARRWRRRYGELDLVVLDDEELVVFVEVKTRRGMRFGAAEAVTRAKQRRLALAASGYLAARGWGERPCRFDVVEVLLAHGEEPGIRHVRDAFRPPHPSARGC